MNELEQIFKVQKDISKTVLGDLDSPHYGLIEEALHFFLLDGIGELDKLKEIYDDAKKRIKVY